MTCFLEWHLSDLVMILYILLNLVFCEIAYAHVHCKMPFQDENLFVRCSIGSQSIPCGDTAHPGTEVEYQCAEYFQLSDKNLESAKCGNSGQWSKAVPKCIEDCGKLSSAVPLVVHGQVIPAGTIPWHAALYELVDNSWSYLCGGSLISSRMIITAAHCAWMQKPEDLQAALGKFYRNYTADDENPQYFNISSIEMLVSYQDVNGNYNGDLAVLILQSDAVLTNDILPVCVDWELEHFDRQIREGNSGISSGWGLTENDTFSEELRAIRLPIMSDEHCIVQQERDFKKFVTYTSFCAGYTNGSGVCNGDSGGGLSFLDEKSDTWYLQGVVSVSPRRRGTPFCDPTHYTVFTKVGAFSTWLHKIEEKEKLIRDEHLPGTVSEFSEQILSSAGNR